MIDINQLMAEIQMRSASQERLIVAIAGAPASGKSTLAEIIVQRLGGRSVVVPMDGFHLDNHTLIAMDKLHRKGAPETFDVFGFLKMVQKLKIDTTVSFPTFDRKADATIPNGGIVTKDISIIILEGNYLLLKQTPWNQLVNHIDFSVFIDVPKDVLKKRLMQRWHYYGLSAQQAINWIDGNDMKNIEIVQKQSAKADLIVSSDTIYK